MSDIAIRVEDLGKKYKIGGKQERYRTIRDTLVDAVVSPIRRAKGVLSGEAYSASGLTETIWALKDVSFEIKHGEVVGIIGRNGAGKSTLLKVLSQITEPTMGIVDLFGRVGSLLEVGTGFHPELTGRENVYLNGAILGMSRAETDRKFDEIVDFAGVEKFIDTPVKHYSSGMQLRLGFAVAAHMEPEILLVDEVLAVGDAEFQKKCMGKMGDVASEGRTVLFVSHNMGAIASLCKRAILLKDGAIDYESTADRVITRYLNSDGQSTGFVVWENGFSNSGVHEFSLYSARLSDEDDHVQQTFDARLPIILKIDFQVKEKLPLCRVGFEIANNQGITLFSSFDVDGDASIARRNPGKYTVKSKIPGNLLKPGVYYLTIHAGITNVKILARAENILVFEIEDTTFVGTSSQANKAGIIQPKIEWDV